MDGQQMKLWLRGLCSGTRICACVFSFSIAFPLRWHKSVPSFKPARTSPFFVRCERLYSRDSHWSPAELLIGRGLTYSSFFET